MFAFVDKASLIDSLLQRRVEPPHHHLKYIQDAWLRHHLRDLDHGAIVEIGGGASRTITEFARRGLDSWNCDRFEGMAKGPLKDNPAIDGQKRAGVTIREVYIGDNSPEVPEAHFDVAYSISVMEHLDAGTIADCFRDCRRILKPGGRVIHLVDLFLGDTPFEKTTHQIAYIRKGAEAAGFELAGEDSVGREPVFRSCYATPSPVYLAEHWCFNAELRSRVETLSLCSFISEHIKR